MSLRKITFSLSFLFTLICIKGQDITEISGHAPDLVGYTVYLYGYQDYITEEKELLDSTQVAEDGEFLLNFESDEIRYVELASNYLAAYLYTQPGVFYDLELPLPEEDQVKAFGRKAKTEVIFNNLALEDINALIIDFNYNYEGFFQANYETLRSLFSPSNYASLNDSVSRPASASSSVNRLFEETEKFALTMDSVYREWDNPYFQLYRSAVLGDLMMNSSATPREIYEAYIEPYSFNAQHPEFTRLHERFYKFYLARHAQSYDEAELNQVLNVAGDYQALKSLFAKDDFLADPLRMDVIINHAIEEVWASNSMNHHALIAVLNGMVESGASPVSRNMAQVMVNKLTALKKGFVPKDIVFENQGKEQKRISDYTGQALLIEFWAPWCSSCIGERNHLLSLRKEYDDLLQIISVEVLEPGKKATEVSEKGDIIRTSTPSESSWISAYQVMSLPHYILIDAEGKVYQDRCPLPSEGLEAILYKLKADKKAERRTGVGRKEN